MNFKKYLKFGCDEKETAKFIEAINIIDKDGDGTINHKEHKACFEELVNFTDFLNLFAQELNGTGEGFKLLNNFDSGNLSIDMYEKQSYLIKFMLKLLNQFIFIG